MPVNNWKTNLRNLEAKDFVKEGCMLVFLMFYILNYIRGCSKNKELAANWYNRHIQFLSTQFSRVGGESNSNEIYTRDGNADFLSFCTGRENITRVDIRVSLRPRQDILARIVNFLLYSIFGAADITDRVFIDIYPEANKFDGFVWGLAHKESLQMLREQRFDVGFARSVDVREIGNWVTMLTESAEIAERVWTEELQSALRESERVLEWLLISDQPEDEPTKAEYESCVRIQLCLKLCEADSALVEAAIKIVDQLVEKCHFRAEVCRKLQVSREDARRQIKKKYEGAGEHTVKRKVEKEKAEKERVSRMSASEQRKFLEKKQDKMMRRAMNRRVQKG